MDFETAFAAFSEVYLGYFNPNANRTELLSAFSEYAPQFGLPGVGGNVIPPDFPIENPAGGGGGAMGGIFSPMAIAQWIRDNARGVQDLSPGQIASENVGVGGQPMPKNLNQANYDINHAKTYIPLPFRMHHVRARGIHLAMLGNRIVFKFSAKKAAAAFCRNWNATFASIGQAEEFIPQDPIQAFSDMVIGGSGQFGLDNQFSPPFRGRIVASTY